eukprot:GFKZ01000362.1.p1 GENE.GFKZ01000362.1~~GFKZ01000362.1.p1  ORF type:complete len:479 (-),score=91.17 GFKZ01000362.1:741-2177(-)
MPEEVSDLRAFRSILQTSGKKLVVVDFHASWCGPCHAIAPFYEQLASRYEGRARFLKVDVDSAQEIASQCAVSAMPTFHFYVGGRLVSKFSGADQRRLAQEVERHAPSSAEVAFGGQGQRLGAGGPSAPAASAPPSGPPKIDWNVRETAAAAAARRMEEAKKAAAESKAAAKAGDEVKDEKESVPEAVKGSEVDAESATAGDEASSAKNDSRLNVNPAFLITLVNEMGFPKIRAEKALILTGNKSVEQAVEWCFQHADDPDVDDPLQIVTSEGAPKPKLSPEEAKKKAEELYMKARLKREAEEKKEEIEREKNRLRSGKEMTMAKREFEQQERKRIIEEKKREKLEAIKERQRVRAMLEADKQRRREKFNMPGSQPAAESKTPVAPQPAPKREAPPSAAAGKIQFRLPDGSRLEGEFVSEQTMGDLATYLEGAKPELAGRRISFSQQYPRRQFSQSDYGTSLGELKLLPRGALTVSFS